MPQALPFAFAAAASTAATGVGASVATTATVAATAATVGSVAAAVGPLALSIGLSYVVGKLFAPEVPTPSGGQIEFQQPIPPWLWHYGRLQVAGPLGLLRIKNAEGGRNLRKLVIVCGREIDGYEVIFGDDRALILDAEGNALNAFTDDQGTPEEKLRVVTEHLGTADQLVDQGLNETYSDWTDACRLRGIAYLTMLARSTAPDSFQEVFPNGAPELKALIRGAKLYDPRKDSTMGGSGSHRSDDPATWEFSDNARLAAFDWLTQPEGWGFAVGDFDLASWNHGFDLCDEVVPLKNGATEPRYRIAATVNLHDEPRKAVLERLLAASDGQIFINRDGKIAIRGGEWTPPTVSIDCDGEHRIDAEFGELMPKLSRYNELKVSCLIPTSEYGYGEIEIAPWRNESDIAANGLTSKDLDLSQVPSLGQASRLAKVRMAQDNPTWTGSLTTDLSGLDAIGEAAVTLNWSELDGGDPPFNGPFWIDDAELQLSANGTVTLAAKRADPDAYSWNAATEEPDPPPVPGDSGDSGLPYNIVAVSGPSPIAISWTFPDGGWQGTDAVICRVFRAPFGASFDDAVDVSGPIEGAPEDTGNYSDAVGPGTYSYWITIEKFSAPETALPAGPVSATAT